MCNQKYGFSVQAVSFLNHADFILLVITQQKDLSNELRDIDTDRDIVNKQPEQ